MVVDVPVEQAEAPPEPVDSLLAARLREGTGWTTNTAHLTPLDDDEKRSILKEWRETLSKENMEQRPCAVCSRLYSTPELNCIDAGSIDLSLLRNEHIPPSVLPTDYCLQAYNGALLCGDALEERDVKGKMAICRRCESDLRRAELPKFALANFLYYGRAQLPEDISKAFAESTCFERALVSRARCNSLCARIPISDIPEAGEERSSSVFYKVKKAIKGNVIVSPLDAVRMRDTLPPPLEAIRDTFCAVFITSKMPDRETIRSLNPVLVRRTRVEVMLHFLLGNNPHYRTVDGFKGFSADNLNSLFTDSEFGSPVQFVYLPANPALSGANAGFTSCNIATADGREVEGILMENVGYTISDETPANYREMKYDAVQRVLGGKPFLVSTRGNRMIPDFDNPFLLAWLFPHLDPWGIGGFHHPLRQRRLSLEEQLGHLLQVSDKTFQSDPEFAFVFYNIMRKKNVSTSMSFSVPATSYNTIVRDIMALDKAEVIALGQKYKRMPTYKCVSDSEKKISRVLASVGPVARRVPGSVGYKLSRRNEIRALINFRGAPTLFVTITPSDLHNPIVSVLAGRELIGTNIRDMPYDETFQRALTAARNPAACAKFFDIMIKSYLSIILRFGKDKPGVYG
ncbi:hypothetical protein DFP72DRAFT_824924, partial [Ephemerocybe angulata]